MTFGRFYNLCCVLIVVLITGCAGPSAEDLKGNEPPAISDPGEKGPSLRIITYNVSLREFLRTERARAVSQILVSSNADVIAFQEMTPEYYALLKSDTRFSETYRLIPGKAAWIKGRMVVASRLPVVSSRYYRLPGRMGRYAQRVEFRIESGGQNRPGNSRTFSLVNLHLESYLNDGPIRARQIRSISPLIKEPAIMLGDFNFGDEAKAEPERRSIPRGHRDLWREMHGQHPGLTWNQEENPLSLMFRFEGEESRRLDYIFLFEDSWKLQNVVLLGTEKVLKYRGKEIPPSDHYGVMADLQIPDTRSNSAER